jgi:hypothetical protein
MLQRVSDAAETGYGAVLCNGLYCGSMSQTASWAALKPLEQLALQLILTCRSEVGNLGEQPQLCLTLVLHIIGKLGQLLVKCLQILFFCS